LRKSAVLVVASIALAGCASRAPAPPPPLTMAPRAPSQLTQSFVQAAVSSHLFEMQSAELALHVSRDPAVRAYAQSLYNDHSRLLNRTSLLVESAGVSSPSPILQPQHFKLFNQLQTTTRAQFDETFRNVQAMAHLQAIDITQRYAATGDNAVLRGLASETLPVIQTHLAAAQGLKIVPTPRYQARPRPGERG
jgi:putative membrane protein